MPHWKRSTREAGFSLLELMISMTVFGVILGSVGIGMMNMQKTFRSNEVATNLHQELRGTLELMSQEIGQAGLAGHGFFSGVTPTTFNTIATNYSPDALTTTTAATTTTGNNITFTVSSTTGLFPGEFVVIDTNGNQEPVQICEPAVSTCTCTSTTCITTTSPYTFVAANVQFTHLSGVPVFVQGVYYQGVWTTLNNAGVTTTLTTANVSAPGGAYTSWPATSLRIFGDINGNGTFAIVDYICPTASGNGTTGTSTAISNYTDSNGTVWGPLVRNEYGYASTTATAPTLLNQRNMLDWVAVPTSTTAGCQFTLSVPPYVTVSANLPIGGSPANSYVFITSVGVTIKAMSGTVVNGAFSPRNDPRTNQPVLLLKSFMNIQPRNIVGAYYLAVNDQANSVSDPEIQPTPATIQTILNGLP